MVGKIDLKNSMNEAQVSLKDFSHQQMRICQQSLKIALVGSKGG